LKTSTSSSLPAGPADPLGSAAVAMSAPSTSTAPPAPDAATTNAAMARTIATTKHAIGTQPRSDPPVAAGVSAGGLSDVASSARQGGVDGSTTLHDSPAGHERDR